MQVFTIFLDVFCIHMLQLDHVPCFLYSVHIAHINLMDLAMPSTDVPVLP